jgi:hypothetical protein
LRRQLECRPAPMSTSRTRRDVTASSFPDTPANLSRRRGARP